MLKKGDRTGDFSFRDSEGREYSLAEFRGKRAVVFFFYPMDFSPGCTKEVCYFRDYYRELTDLGAEVFGVSANSAESHVQFREKHSLPYPLVPDTDGGLRRRFGTGRLGGLLGSKRVTFLVTPDGDVIETVHSELSMMAHVERAMEVLKELKEHETK